MQCIVFRRAQVEQVSLRNARALCVPECCRMYVLMRTSMFGLGRQ